MVPEIVNSLRDRSATVEDIWVCRIKNDRVVCAAALGIWIEVPRYQVGLTGHIIDPVNGARILERAIISSMPVRTLHGGS